MWIFARPQDGIFDGYIARFRYANDSFAVRNRIFYYFSFRYRFNVYLFIVSADNGFYDNVLYALFRQRIDDNVAMDTREIIEIVVYNLFILGKILFFSVYIEIPFTRTFAKFVAGFKHSQR